MDPNWHPYRYLHNHHLRCFDLTHCAHYQLWAGSQLLLDNQSFEQVIRMLQKQSVRWRQLQATGFKEEVPGALA